MATLVDLHSHTHFSDGSLAPDALHALMRKRGVAMYAVTDHDTIGAHHIELAPAPLTATDTPAAALEPQRLVGVEINTTYANNEVHILGYGFAARGSSLDAVLAQNRAYRLLRIEMTIARLAEANLPLTFEEVQSAAGPAQALGRPHVARAMVARGYASDVRSAIMRYLRRGGAGYVASEAITPFAAIEAIHEAGGIAVLAHPCRLDDYGLIEIFARAGIDGLEVFYPRNTTKQTAHFQAEAERFGLLCTAGADFHDPVYNARGVGMEAPFSALRPFFDRILATGAESLGA